MLTPNTIGKLIRNEAEVSKNVARKIHRDRVLEFEREIQDRLRKLTAIEEGMNEISQQRKEWLENISQNHLESSNTFQQHVRLFQLESELIGWKFKLNTIALDEEYENHLLDLLINYTKPLQENETEDLRNAYIQQKSREKTTQMKYTLQNTLNERIDLNAQVHNLHFQYAELKYASEHQQRHQYEELKHNLNEYLKMMAEQKAKFGRMSHEVMKDYLILRHNASVIQTVLQANQNHAAAIRHELQQVLDGVVCEAQEQRTKLEKLSQDELVTLTSDLRTEIATKESLVEQYHERIEGLKSQKTEVTLRLYREIVLYDKQHQSLQATRHAQQKVITSELAGLKEQIRQLERQLYVAKVVEEEGNTSQETVQSASPERGRTRPKSSKPLAKGRSSTSHGRTSRSRSAGAGAGAGGRKKQSKGRPKSVSHSNTGPDRGTSMARRQTRTHHEQQQPDTAEDEQNEMLLAQLQQSLQRLELPPFTQQQALQPRHHNHNHHTA